MTFPTRESRSFWMLLALAGLSACAAPGALLVSRDESVRARAYQELGSQPPEERKKDVPALVSALGSDQAVVRRLAADGLARLGPAAEAAVPALIRALSDGDLEARLRAVRALGAIGPGAAPAVPALSRALKTRFGGVGLELSRKDGRLIAQPFRGYPAAGAGLRDGDWIVEIDGRPTASLSIADAAEFLRGVPGSRAAMTVRSPESGGYSAPRDISVLRGEIPVVAVCRAAAQALAKIGPTARAAFPALKELETENIESLRSAARDASERIAADGPSKN